MSYKSLVSFVGELYEYNQTWEGDLIDLSDENKDDLVFLWIITHKTWLADIFPHTVDNIFEPCLSLLYKVDCSPPEDALANVFKAAEKMRRDECDNDAFFSEATGDFEDILNADNFTSIYRDRVYLTMEPNLRDRVQEAFNEYIWECKEEACIH